jgi:hypothetical protein
MCRNRTWGVLGVLILVQAGIIICYYDNLSGNAAPPKDAAPETKQDKPAKPCPPPKSKVENKTPDSGPMEVVPVTSPAVPTSLVADPLVAPPPVSGEKSSPPPPATAEVPPVVPTSPVTKKNEAPVKQQPVTPVPPPSVGPGPGSSGDSGFTGTPPVNPPVVGVAKNPTPPQSVSVAQPLIPEQAGRIEPVAACPWNLRLAIVAGKTHLTAQTGKEVRFRVICDQLNLQAPRGTIAASGGVKLSSSGLEGTCDNLTISWQEDQVVLDGQAQLKCHREGQDLELKAAKLSLRLTPSGMRKATQTRHKTREETDSEEDEDGNEE